MIEKGVSVPLLPYSLEKGTKVKKFRGGICVHVYHYRACLYVQGVNEVFFCG